MVVLPVKAGENSCDYSGFQLEMNTCAAEDYDDAFKEYVLTYQGTLRAMNSEGRARMKYRSDAWARAVNLQCRKQSDGMGSDTTIFFYICLQQAVEVRTLSLRARQPQV